MRRYHYHGPGFEENGLGELPDTPKPLYLQSRFWGGIICALLFGGYGLYSMVTLHSYFYVGSSRQFLIELFGVDAFLAGGFYLMLGATLHFRYYWQQSEKLFEYSTLLTNLSLIIGGIFLFLHFWHGASLTLAMFGLIYVWVIVMITRA